MKSGAITRLNTLQVVLTSACNLNCAYCYQNRRRAGAMKWEVLRPALDLVVESGHPRPAVSFHGGEPLLEFPMILRAIQYLKEKCPATMKPIFHLVTNGTLMSDDVLDVLSENGVRTGLSFDGIREAQDLRAPGTFPILERLISNLHERHPSFVRQHLTVACAVWSGNLKYLNQSVRFFHEIGVSAVALTPLLTSDPGWGQEMLDELENQFALLDRTCREHLDETGKVPLTLFRRHQSGGRSTSGREPRCGATGGGRIAVDVDGRLHPCVVLARSFQSYPEGLLSRSADGLDMGYVSRSITPLKLDEFAQRARQSGIFNSRERNFSSFGKCIDCRFFDTCSVCPISIGHISQNEDPNRVPDHQCAFNRVALDYRERFPPQADSLGLLRSLMSRAK